MTAQEAMEKLSKWAKQHTIAINSYSEGGGWIVQVVVGGWVPKGLYQSNKPSLTDAVAEIAAKMEKDLGN